MKRIVLILLALTTFNAFSQSTYGLVTGINATDSESDGGGVLSSSDAPGLDGFNIGAYIDFPINNKLGIKSYITFNRENETYNSYIFKEYNFNIKVTSIQLNSNLKYHLKNKYYKGIYLLSGPRISSVLSTSNKVITELNDTHKKFNFGFQFGFGFKVLNFLTTEFIGDFGLSNTIKIEDKKFNTYNLKLNLNIDLKKMIHN